MGQHVALQNDSSLIPFVNPSAKAFGQTLLLGPAMLSVSYSAHTSCANTVTLKTQQAHKCRSLSVSLVSRRDRN